MVDWFSPSVRYWWLLQALPDFISCLFTCSDVECLFKIMNNKWLLLKVLSIYCFYLTTTTNPYFLNRVIFCFGECSCPS